VKILWRLTLFATRQQPPNARNSLFCNILHHWHFGFVWTLFNPLGSICQTSGIPNLPVVPVAPRLAAVADRAASRLPKSLSPNVSIRHAGSLVRAGGRVSRNSPLFRRFSIPASSSASHSLATDHCSRATVLPYSPLATTSYDPPPLATTIHPPTANCQRPNGIRSRRAGP